MVIHRVKFTGISRGDRIRLTVKPNPVFDGVRVATKEIVLCTLNARFHHTAFGLRYLFANLGELQARAEIVEFVIKRSPREIADELIARAPKILGFGVYIWNVRETTEVLRILRAERPDIRVVLGGPEVSYETETQEIFTFCDHVIRGEADFLFRDFCARALGGDPPSERIIAGPRPNIAEIQFPYEYYTENDLRHRIVYVEASRGCPYKCEYCLSSLDEKVRDFSVDAFLEEMRRLIERGARTFKFVDRTFNLSVTKSARILNFFLERVDLGLFLHFEMVPDRLPGELRDLIRRFPPGALQFEIGIQTMNPAVARKISRRQDYVKIAENLRFLREETGVHTHADLIAGLPGENLESFAAGFDGLVRLAPDEVQVGILKRLKGTPIVRHDRDEDVTWSQEPPFSIVSNKSMSANEVAFMKDFADVWDMYWNSGRFKTTMASLREYSRVDQDGSLFSLFRNMAERFRAHFGRTHGVSLEEQFRFLKEFLTGSGALTTELGTLLARDYLVDGRNALPSFLRSGVEGHAAPVARASLPVGTPSRQRRHMNVPQI